MAKFSREEGLTLVELLVVIALVGVVASIALPILINTVANAQASADAQSTANRAAFSSDWSTAGYSVVANGNGFAATDASGATVATIG